MKDFIALSPRSAPDWDYFWQGSSAANFFNLFLTFSTFFNFFFKPFLTFLTFF